MPAPLDRWTHQRVPIALRWWITRNGDLLTGWPAPGLEADAMAMGWIAQDSATGVIELPEPPIDVGILDILEQRFSDRRWFAGDWQQDSDQARVAA